MKHEMEGIREDVALIYFRAPAQTREYSKHNAMKINRM
jgi:hypothetical protein